MKMSTHKTLYCYLALILWIFILVAGLYKFMGKEAVMSTPKPGANANILVQPLLRSGGLVNTKRVTKLCNLPENIHVGSEGDVNSNYTLEGVLLLFRHGDRGPLSHVRNISQIRCGPRHPPPSSLSPYWSFLHNMSQSPEFLRFLGPFQTFPLSPSPDEDCSLGQLTRLGVAQLLRTGEVLRAAYKNLLVLSESEDFSAHPLALVYSTRYRRTFQSALAFLYAFLGPKRVLKVALRESQSLSFCFEDCACPVVDVLRKSFSRGALQYLKSHPVVHALVHSLAAAVFEDHGERGQGPRVLEDALLAYLCHASPLPCVWVEGGQHTCVEMEHVNHLLAYNEWEAKQYVKSRPLVRSFLLQSYGLVRNLLSHLIRIMSEEAKNPRLVLYSGHDKTMQHLMFAMGISDGSLPPYASRLVLELYRHVRSQETTPDRFFFRVVYNGRDVTSRVSFCRKSAFRVVGNWDSGVANSFSEESVYRRRPSYLCRIESIIRFLHDDYFQLFNATNFKDVCFPNGFTVASNLGRQTARH